MLCYLLAPSIQGQFCRPPMPARSIRRFGSRASKRPELTKESNFHPEFHRPFDVISSGCKRPMRK